MTRFIKENNIQNCMSSRRKELGLTLEEVGNIVGGNKSTVRKWETGFIDNMKCDKILLLAKALKISPLSLLGTKAEESENKTCGILSNTHESLINKIKNIDDGTAKSLEDYLDFLLKKGENKES